jgi:uncharacterized protein YpiB (UPF0302 family)
MKNLIFHTLKGVKGWSYLDIDKIDVARVNKMFYYRRSFCLFQEDKPYTLFIDYHLPKLKILPIIFNFIYVVDLEQHITKRYSNKEEVVKEIFEINRKKEILEKYFERKGQTILDEVLLDEKDERQEKL